jgi:hypothetical protein
MEQALYHYEANLLTAVLIVLAIGICIGTLIAEYEPAPKKRKYNRPKSPRDEKKGDAE